MIGVPNPVLWGILGMLLRFVPYIGAWIAAALPIAISFAVDPGWSMTLWTAILFLVVEPIIGQVLEPLLYGHSTGVTPKELDDARAVPNEAPFSATSGNW